LSKGLNLTGGKIFGILFPERGEKYMKILSIDASTKSTGWCIG